MKVPNGLKEGLVVNALTGHVEVGMVRAGKLTGAIKLTPKGAGMVAASILDTAKSAGPPVESPPTPSPMDWLHMTPSSFSLAESPIPNSVELVMSFGQATLGVAIPKRDLKGLAQAMLALSADGNPQ